MNKIYLYTLCFFISISSTAQIWKELNDSVRHYIEKGDFENAIIYAQKNLVVVKTEFGNNHKFYAGSLNNLGSLYVRFGQYAKAEPLLLESLQIRKNLESNTSADYALGLSNLAGLFKEMGQYEKAESLYTEASSIWKKELGEGHPYYATSLSNLGGIYMAKGQISKAGPFLKEATEIRKKVLGETHPDYGKSLAAVGSVLAIQGDYKVAELVYNKAASILKAALGSNHADYASCLKEQAALYELIGQFEKAELFFLEVIRIEKESLGSIHPAYTSSLRNLAELYLKMGKPEKAEPLLLENSRTVLKQMENNFIAFSENEKQNYIKNEIYLLETNNSFLYNYRNASELIVQNNFNQQLVFKSLILEDSKKIFQSAQKNIDIVVQNILTDWKNNKQMLSRQYSLPVANRRTDLKDVEISTEKLEKELGRNSLEFKRQQIAMSISLADVQKNLQPNEVAIEFVNFHLYNKKWTDSVIYAVYILTKKDPVPIFVPLCEEKQLGKYFSSTTGSATIKSLYRSDVVDEDEKPAISGDSLYALIWKPLLPYLKDVKKINYSPAGLLYKVAFHALPAGENQLLLDKYELNQYTSTRQLAITDEKKNLATSITLFGDCQFTMDSTSIVKNITANETANSLITASTNRGEATSSWKQLPGTADEIEGIKNLFEANKIITTLFSKVNATEDRFKKISGNSPKILHLATHGFILPDPEKKKQEGFAADERNAFTLADDPLLRSGIVLSGANRVWSGQPPIAGREDGIVTSYEIAQMDLSNTDLVVLSACETALGDIKGNEGVFGLQRAFKMAGVKNMLLSLWKVPDTETAELMQIFYTNYLQGKTAREALAIAQKEMRKKYKPYYWAAFVLIE